MSYVKKVWMDEDDFSVELVGSGWAVVFHFPISELASGASLSRMMNLKVREAAKNAFTVVPAGELKAAAREGVAELRQVVEPYFTRMGIGEVA